MNKKIVTILILLFSLYFLIRYYPRIGDGFDYWQMAKSIAVESRINDNNVNIGFYIFIVILKNITNISYETIPFLPFISVTLILFLTLLISNITKSSKLIVSLVFLYIINPSYYNTFMLWPHGVGFLLFIQIIYLILLGLKSKTNNSNITLISIISIISLNYVSYKLTFLALTFLIFVQIFRFDDGRFNIKTITLLGLINALGFNKFIYDTFIPRLFSDVTTLGIDKLASSIVDNPNDILNEYYYRTPFFLKLSNVILLFLNMVILFVTILILSKKIAKKDVFTEVENITFALISSSLIITILYTFLGLSDFRIITTFGIMSISLIYNMSKNLRKIVLINVLLMFVLSIYVNIEYINYGLDKGLKDYIYVDIPSKWYIKNVHYEGIQDKYKIASDVFTGGYINKELTKNNISLYLNIFARNDISFILKPEMNIRRKNMIFIINNELYPVPIIDWWLIRSFSNFKQDIGDNKHFNIVYSSGNIYILKGEILYDI